MPGINPADPVSSLELADPILIFEKNADFR
jgi:hypothetical protein